MAGFSFSIHGIATITKYLDEEHYLAGKHFAIVVTRPNEIMYGGASSVWELMIGTWLGANYGAGTAHIGVGDGSGGGRTLNDLTGGNKFRKAMDSGYPQHVDGFTAANAKCKFRSTFTGAQANFQWREWGIFNAPSGGRMLNHETQNNGKKKPGMVWVMEVEGTID